MNRARSSLLLLAALTSASCGEPTGSTPPPGAGAAAGTVAGGSVGQVTAGTTGTSGGQGGSAGDSGAAGAGQMSAGTAGTAGLGGGSPGMLVVSPIELVFAGVQQTQLEPKSISLENVGSIPLLLESFELDAAASGTGAFELVNPPPAGTELSGGAKRELQVRFNPSGVALFESRVLVQSGPPSLETSVALFGLGTQGLEGENEPFLKIVLTTLGFDVDVGGAGLLSTTTPLVGSEVSAQRFEAAGAGPIGLVPVARYSPEEPIPYGYYTPESEVEVGVISADQYQALHPGTDPGSERSFADPGVPFGIFTVSQTHSTYTEDSKNAGNQVAHAARTYPLRARDGSAIQNAYLVCFEEAANGDYQDYVFTLSNVKPAAP